MIPLTRRQREALDDASLDRSSLGSACPFVLTIDGADHTGLVGDEGHLRILPQEKAPVVLEGRIATRLAESVKQTECRVEHVVRGERITSYVGEVYWIKARGYYSDFLAATGSHHAEETNLGDGPEDDLEYLDAEPSSALYEAASRLQDSYRGIEIPRVSTPKFSRARSVGEEPFRWIDKVSDLYEAIEADTGLAAEDTPLNVLTGRVAASVLSETATEWVFEEGRDFDYDGLSAEPREEGVYARVSGYRTVGGAPVVAGPKGGAKVDNRGLKVRRDSTLLLNLTDENEEAAFAAVYRRALALSENPLTLSWPSAYPPFWLQRGDPVLVRGKEITAAGTWVREYRARLTSNAPDLWERRGELQAIGGLVSERFVARKGAAGLRPAGVARARHGLDHLGRLRFSAPWARVVEGSGVALHAAEAARTGVTVALEEGRGIRIGR